MDGLLDKPADAKALLAAGFADGPETLAPLLSFASAYLTVKAGAPSAAASSPGSTSSCRALINYRGESAVELLDQLGRLAVYSRWIQRVCAEDDGKGPPRVPGAGLGVHIGHAESATGRRCRVAPRAVQQNGLPRLGLQLDHRLSLRSPQPRTAARTCRAWPSKKSEVVMVSACLFGRSLH